MVRQLQFKVSSELKNIIGKELITDDFIAVFELVKNSYDANAKKVELVFDHAGDTGGPGGRILVIDDGDGMSYEDLTGKWLLVGYSEKSELEAELGNKDYRHKIGARRIFAGAKGIGRFSCDKLGGRLKLYTKKENDKVIHALDMDWGKFEKDPKAEFETIDVNYETQDSLSTDIPVERFRKGTVLEISALRNGWGRGKMLELKRHLQRLINPAQVGEKQEFAIYLKAEEYLEEDEKHKEDYEKVNGMVRNYLFERLGIKTTQINCRIDKGDRILTELIDKGTFIYRIEEENGYSGLHDINITLFYMNQSAKVTFTRTMGIEPVRYGSVFFYKNGIKINPCGNEGDDWLGLDRRKTQGTRRFLGNRDVMGRIEVSQPEFREVSSRDGGVVRTPELELLKELFEKEALRRLEKYVIEGINWDSESRPKDPEQIKVDSFKIIGQLAGRAEESGRKITFNKNLLDIFAKKQVEKTPQLIKNIDFVRKHIKSKEARAYVDLQAKAVRSAFRDLQTRQRELEEELERKTLFLERVTGQEKVEILPLQHQIGIGAGHVKRQLLMLRDRMEKKEPISNEFLLGVIDEVLLQVQMMRSITLFVTQANFDLESQKIESDLISFIEQYVKRAYSPYDQGRLEGGNVAIRVDRPLDTEFKSSFNPFEFIVVLDNLINNSIDAKARHIDVKVNVSNENTLELRVIDDGAGISDEDLDKIFTFGFSRTGGAGIGLYQVKKIIARLGGSIEVNNHLDRGVEFIIKVVRR